MLRAAAAIAIAIVVLALTGVASQVDRNRNKKPRVIVVPFDQIMVDEERPWCDADGFSERCA